MLTAKGIFISFITLLAYSIVYGLGLAFGFFLMGKITGYFDYFVLGSLERPEERKERMDLLKTYWFTPSFISKML